MSRTTPPLLPGFSKVIAVSNEKDIEDGYATPPPAKAIQDSLQESIEGLRNSVIKHSSETKTWENCFEKNLAIGEFHSDLSPKRFLIENMDLLKREGYKIIFLEHVAQSDFGESLREFSKTKIMPQDLKAKLSRLDFGHLEPSGEVNYDLYDCNRKEFNFTTLVEAAVENGIKVVGLEISDEIWKSYKAGANRMAILNENTRLLISVEEEKFAQENNGQKLKWICFVGSGHLKTYEGVPGICDVVDAQDILISDCQRLQTPKMVFDEQTRSLYSNSQLPINVSMALNWEFDQEMRYEKIMEFREKEITKADLCKSSSDSESDTVVKRKYAKELQEPQSNVTNPAKRARKLKSKSNETVLEK